MRKRYLIVAMDMSDSAPGAVFRTLSQSLYKYADVDVLSPKYDKNDSLEGIGLIRLHRYRLLDWPETKQIYKRLHFNYNDFLKQLSMIKKMGSLKSILGMIPGMGAQLKNIDIDDKHI